MPFIGSARTRPRASQAGNRSRAECPSRFAAARRAGSRGSACTVGAEGTAPERPPESASTSARLAGAAQPAGVSVQLLLDVDALAAEQRQLFPVHTEGVERRRSGSTLFRWRLLPL